jgi:hypothetical protein
MLIIGRRFFSAPRGFLITVALAVLLFSCDLSSGFLSDSERSSVYTLTIGAANGSVLADGTVILPGTEITAVVAKKAGAGDLASLDFSLGSQNGKNAASLRLFTPSAKTPTVTSSAGSASTSSKSVASIEGKLAGFFVPEDIAPGYYVLSASITGADGGILQKNTVNIFVGHSRPIIQSVSTFPPSVEPGASVLLGLAVSWLPLAAPPIAVIADAPASGTAQAAKSTGATVGDAHDPWIRWRRDGSTFAEGLLSNGLDRVVWPAPRTEGAYSISVEVFPSAPLAGSLYSFFAPVRQDLKVMVIASPGGSGNDFADPLAFYSLLRLDGSFDDAGTRPRIIQPESFGSPSLETYSSGFGYRFGPSSGVRIPGLMPPISSGKIAAFSTILRLDSEKSDGVLVRFASDDGSYALVLGIKDSRPYVESQAAGKTQRSTAVSPIPRFPLTIAASLKPEGDMLSISWNAEGERIDAPSLPLPPTPPEGSAQIGGAQSLPGVYDGFGLLAGGNSPSYRLASRRKWKASLIIAESFEDGALPPLSSASGGVSASSGSLLLEPGGALALEPSFGIASAVVIEADIEGDRSSCAVVLSTPRGERVLSVGGTGDVDDPSGKTAGSLPSADGRISFLMELKNGTIVLRNAGGSNPVTLRSAANRFALSLKRDGGSGRAAFNRVLVRASVDSATLK